MTEHYAVKEADCTPEQIEQIYNLAQVNINAKSYNYRIYEPNRWEFIVFDETEEVYQCSKTHFNNIRVELIAPAEAIQRLFETYLEK